jgi:hypothetical protein
MPGNRLIIETVNAEKIHWYDKREPDDMVVWLSASHEKGKVPYF